MSRIIRREVFLTPATSKALNVLAKRKGFLIERGKNIGKPSQKAFIEYLIAKAIKAPGFNQKSLF